MTRRFPFGQPPRVLKQNLSVSRPTFVSWGEAYHQNLLRRPAVLPSGQRCSRGTSDCLWKQAGKVSTQELEYSGAELGRHDSGTWQQNELIKLWREDWVAAKHGYWMDFGRMKANW